MWDRVLFAAAFAILIPGLIIFFAGTDRLSGFSLFVFLRDPRPGRRQLGFAVFGLIVFALFLLLLRIG